MIDEQTARIVLGLPSRNTIKFGSGIGQFMARTDDGKEIATLAEIMAELKGDAKSLSKDLVDGIQGFNTLGDILLGLGLFAAVASIFLLLPQYYTGLAKYATVGMLYVLSGYSIVFGWRILRRYSDLKKKYSSLMEITSRLGE